MDPLVPVTTQGLLCIELGVQSLGFGVCLGLLCNSFLGPGMSFFFS